MNKTLFVISIFILFINFVECSFCGYGGWVAFEDEKCFKLVNRVVIREEAEQICNNQAKSNPTINFLPTLVSVKSPEEQQFLERYLFETSGAMDSVWISAKRKLENTSDFEWNDGSELEYNNWAEGHPTNDTNRKCVQMQAKYYSKNLTNLIESSNEGEWVDVPCEKNNQVLCEKLQTWSFPQMQKNFLDSRRELKDSLKDVAAQLSDTSNKLDINRNELEDLRRNPVPIGFIYTQISGQPAPKDLWPTVEWKDVTSDYAGLFFRAEGGGSAAFGKIQNENSPRLSQVHSTHSQQPYVWLIDTIPGEWSPYILVAPYPEYLRGFWLRFNVSGGEVRPRNQAIRIWKRTK